MLLQYHEKNKLELGIDEVGRGCLLGPVCVGGVIWLDEDPDDLKYDIIDSKKCTKNKLNYLNEFIINNCISYSVKLIDNDCIDNINILQATYKCMHNCIDDILDNIKIDKLLIDGDKFKMYIDKENNIIPNINIVNGDNKYKSIACASILAKTYRDSYIDKLVNENPELEKYDIKNNKGYGTKKHIDAIKKYGITKWHRKTFGICKNFT